jgi:hypothetical protein
MPSALETGHESGQRQTEGTHLTAADRAHLKAVVDMGRS